MGADNKPILISLAVVAAVVVGYLAWVAFTPGEEDTSTTVRQAIEVPEGAAPAPVAETSAQVEEMPNPMLEPEEPEPIEVPATDETPAFMLPRLSESDGLVRDGIMSLSTHGGMELWLAGSDLIRKFVALTDNVARGKVPRGQLTFMAPDGAFQVARTGEKSFQLDENSYRRYDLATDIFASIDSHRAAEFYDLLRPLFQQAYEELGYGDRHFDDVIFVAIGRLLETPTPPQPIQLVRPTVLYEFADRRLESLSAAQKQLIRMGPRNTRVIQGKLSEFALELRTILNK